MIAALPRLGVLLAFSLVLQLAVLDDVRVAGVRPEVMILLPVVAGVAGGPERGAILGFVAGLVTDLFAETPFGLSSLTYSILGFGTGALQSSLIRSTWWITPATAAVATGVGMALYALTGAMVGQRGMVGPRLAVVVAAVGIINAFLALPLARIARWSLRPLLDDRPRLT